MELLKIEQLLDKYWEGVTSLQEEEQLKHYFNTQEVPAHLQATAQLFRSFSRESEHSYLDDHFDDELLGKIERSSAFSFSRYRKVFNMAAAISVLVISGIWLFSSNSSQVQSDLAYTENTYEDPQLAYEQTRQALLLVSSIMNEGTQHLEKLESFSEAQEKIKEN